MAKINRFEDLMSWQKGGAKEFIQFLSQAKGSCGEVRCQLYAALDESYLSAAEFHELYERSSEVGRLISGMMTYLKNSELRGAKFKKPATGTK